MKNLDVSIVKLDPAKVIVFHGYGNQPEELAWQKLNNWIKNTGFELQPDKNRIYGYNNPCPSAGSSKYGYEFILTVDDDFEPTAEIAVSSLPGGLYAAAEIQVEHGEEIPQNWKALNLWCEGSRYGFAQHQWLEEHKAEGIPFKLLLPIAE